MLYLRSWNGAARCCQKVFAALKDFSRGEVIRIRNLNGRDLAHGVSRYNSDALRMLAGHHSQQISEILGYEYGPVAVHRDDMIVS